MQYSTDNDPEAEAIWRTVLTVGHPAPFLSRLPSDPKCLGCGIPFAGFGGVITRARGFKPSRKNPNFCNICEDLLPPGGAEIDIAVIFADVRGSTGIAERIGAVAFANLLNRFYAIATKTVVKYHADLDKMVGDEVMILLYPVIGSDYRKRAIHLGVDLLLATGWGSGKEGWLPLGVGINAGIAFVGKIGNNGVYDVTALGDTVNTASRMQGEAKSGELVMSEGLYDEVKDVYPALEQRVVTVRGREEQVTLRVLRP